MSTTTATATSSDRDTYPKPGALTDTNYSGWSYQVQTWLTARKVWKYFDGPDAIPPSTTVTSTDPNDPTKTVTAPNPAFDTWLEGTANARILFVLLLDTSQLIHIRHTQIPAEMWKALADVYKPKGHAYAFSIRNDIDNLRYGGLASGPLQKYISDLQELVSKYRESGGVYSEGEWVEKLISGAGPSFASARGLVSMWEVMNPTQPPTSLGVKNLLLSEETRQRRETPVSGGATTVAFRAGGSRPATPRSNETRTCYYCGITGHIATFCEKKKTDRLRGINNPVHPPPSRPTTRAYATPNTSVPAPVPVPAPTTQVPAPSNSPPVPSTSGSNLNPPAHILAAQKLLGDYYGINQGAAFLVSADVTRAMSSLPKAVTECIIDGGCSQHMFNQIEFFHDYQPLAVPRRINIASSKDGHFIEAVGVGTVAFYTAYELEKPSLNKVTITNVLFVPDLPGNLLSESQLALSPERVIIETDYKIKTLRRSEDTSPFAFGALMESDKIYHMAITPCFIDTSPVIDREITFAYVAQPSACKCHDIQTWHRRLGHFHMDGIRRLASQELVGGLNLEQKGTDLVCEECLLGKSKKLVFYKGPRERKPALLDLVWSDLWGPSKIPSRSGANYVLTFTDDHSNHLEVFFLKNKSDVFDAFKKYKANVELQTGRHIKRIRTDNGEYTSNEFETYLSHAGIEHQLTAPYTPEQDGVSERMNGTLIAMARTTLISSGIDHSYWAEAVNYAAYTLDFCATRTLEGKVPYEAWTGIKPDISYLRPFGCSAFVHILPQIGLDKLKPRALKCKLVGYSKGNPAPHYRCLDPITGKVYISRNVVFVEVSKSSGSEVVISDTREKGERIDNDATELPKVALGDGTKINIEDTDLVDPEPIPVPAPPVPIPNQDEPVIQHEPELQRPRRRPKQPEVDASLIIDGPRLRRPTAKRLAEQEAVREGYFSEEDNGEAGFDRNDDDYRDNDEPQQDPGLPHPVDLTFLTTSGTDPRSYVEATTGSNSQKWKEAMDQEFQSLIDTGTLVYDHCPPDRKPISCKWVYRTKHDSNGNPVRYKARLVARGFSQVPGVDFAEIFAPVVKFNSLRIVIALAAALGLEVYQMDVETAFLNGDLEDITYMNQPQGYEDGTNRSIRLGHPIYGLKQAPRCWYQKAHTTLVSIGFNRIHADHCVWVYRKDSDFVILPVYVDDIIGATNNKHVWDTIKVKLRDKFKIKDMGEAKFVVGIKVDRNRAAGTIKLSQRAYIEEVLARFGMDNCRPVSTPLPPGVRYTSNMSPTTNAGKEEMKKVPYLQAIGSLMFAMLGTRPDLAHAVGVLSRFSSNPGQEHWEGVKHVLRYLRGTLDVGLTYKRSTIDSIPQIVGYSDSDWAGDTDTKRSTGGYIFTLAGAPVTWSSKRQATVATSTMDAEYMACSQAAREAMWLRLLLKELGYIQSPPTTIHVDNQAAISVAKDPAMHAKAKHIEVSHHYVRERIADKDIILTYCPTRENVADIMTKNLPKGPHEQLMKLMGMIDS